MDQRMIDLLAVAVVNLWYATRYARQVIGPDEGLWLLWGMTGSRYGRDWTDCKPPGIHAWMWLLARVTGKRLGLMKWLHHATIGAICVGVAHEAGLGAGLLATVMLQSAWLFAYQSWMDALSGALLLLGIVSDPALALVAFAAAAFLNVKIVVPAAVWTLTQGWWIEGAVAAGLAACAAGAWYLLHRESFRWVWYGSVEVPKRMREWRKGIPPSWKVWPSYWSNALLIAAPAVLICLPTMTPALTLTALSYAALNAWGLVWRPNHWLPLAIVAASAPPAIAAALVLATELIAARGLLGNVWQVTYPGIASELSAARTIGETVGKYLRENGLQRLWVNSMMTQVYVYADTAPYVGHVEQVEITQVTPEKGTEAERVLQAQPPDVIVIGPGARPGTPRGYREILRHEGYTVLR